MALVLAAILTTWGVGMVVALAIDGQARGTALAGLSFLYGAGTVWAALFVLSLIRIPWTALTATGAIVVVASLCLVVWRRSARAATAVEARANDRQLPRSRAGIMAGALADLLTVYTVISYAMFATVTAVGEWDFWAIWGLKARVFVEAGGIDWRFLTSRFNDFAHPDYPLLLPLNYAWTALVNGGWNDRWLGLMNVAFGAAALLVIRWLASSEHGSLTGSLVTLAATLFVLSRYIGLAEGSFIAYSTAAILFIRRGLLSTDRAALRHGAILLGLAASTKNEGLALIVVVAMAIIANALRKGSGKENIGTAMTALGRLWPAVAIVVPWLVTRSLLHLSTDVTRGSVALRMLARLPEAATIFRMLGELLPYPLPWALILIGLLLVSSEQRRREFFVLLTVSLQLMVYVAIYFGSPRDASWLIGTSWPRLAIQFAAPLLFVVMIALARTFSRGETLAHAEARSERH